MMESQMPSHKEDEESCILSRNFRIAALLEFCLQPTTKSEMKSILSEFWRTFEECSHKNKVYCEVDVVCMYALNYVYKHNYLSLSAVSRSFFAYTYQVTFISPVRKRNEFVTCSDSSFLKDLDRLTNIFCLPEVHLQEIFVKCICSLNLGQLRFLVKYISLDFPTELNEKSRHMATRLVNLFNIALPSTDEENLEGDKKIFMKIDDFLKLMEHSDITYRRALLMFIWIRTVFEYYFFENLSVRVKEVYGINTDHTHKSYCIDQFIFLDILTETTTEILITLTDIDNFRLKFLNFLPDKIAGISFMDISKKYLSEVLKCYTPKLLKGENECHTARSLKDLTRCRIRQSLQYSRTLIEQVYQLPIPVTLKNLILFDNEDVWKSLEDYQEMIYCYHNLSRLTGLVE